MRSRQWGMSLIELMVAVGIVGILIAIAYPSYTSYVTSSNRTEAQRWLIQLANLQEQFYLDQRTYSDKVTKLISGAGVTESGYYELDIPTSAAKLIFEFTIRATASGSQATNDTDCLSLTINQALDKQPAKCWE